MPESLIKDFQVQFIAHMRDGDMVASEWIAPTSTELADMRKNMEAFARRGADRLLHFQGHDGYDIYFNPDHIMYVEIRYRSAPAEDKKEVRDRDKREAMVEASRTQSQFVPGAGQPLSYRGRGG